MTAKVCTVSECGNPANAAKGLCHKHYRRFRLHGTTDLTSAQGSTSVNERLSIRGYRSDDGCFEWTGRIGERGYGQTKWNRKFYLVHRLAWTLANGPIPDGMFVCHRCDNPRCYEISHLFLGTPSDNRRDCVTKGRANIQSGVNHPGYKHGRYIGAKAKANLRKGGV